MGITLLEIMNCLSPEFVVKVKIFRWRE